MKPRIITRVAGVVIATAFVTAAGIATFQYLRGPATVPDTIASRSHPLALQEQQPAPTALGWPVVIQRAAGDGLPGFADGSTAQARFADPFGVATDAAGNLYVSDGGDNNRIRRVAPNGEVTTVAGSREGFADGLATAAAFHTPSGLAVDTAGNLYVADTGNNAIRKITPQGVVSTLAGTGQPGFRDGPAAQAQFNGPIGVAVDGQGNVYVADTYNDRIRVIGSDGQVRTLAGGSRPGYQDGAGAAALFDTPCGLAVNARGEIFVADTRNQAIRKIGPDGQVTTLARSLPADREALLRRPMGIALTHDDFLYISDTARGRLLQLSPAGELHGLTGIGIDIEVGDDTAVRFRRPTGLTLDRRGGLYVADAAHYQVRHVTPLAAARTTAVAARPHSEGATACPATAPNHTPAFPWPVAPQHQKHEIVGTMGEVRGNYEGEARDHFHSGVDIQADIGTPVLAIAAEKVSNPLPNWAFGELNEGLSIGTMAYVHMRVGRNAKDQPLDPARFAPVADERGKLARIRVKRGTRFKVGDPLGTVNRMYHVHLDFRPFGTEVNPLSLAFKDYRDQVAPRIETIQVVDAAGRPLAERRRGRLLVRRALGEVGIEAEAYDQLDGNLSRRRLGLHKIGYQVLQADGTPMPGFEQPQVNIEFNCLPPDRESVKVAYAAGSGITVHGNAATRFRYAVTNTVRDGRAKAGRWRVADLTPGDYLIRLTAADFAGNEATAGRDLPITVE